MRQAIRMRHYSRRTESAHVPVVLTPEEVHQVLQVLDGTVWIIVALLYGAGLRLQECLELRVQPTNPQAISDERPDRT